MRVVDTSAWLEWLSGTELGRKLGAALPARQEWLLPTIVHYELARHLARAHKLAMADAIIYATAIEHDADLLTCDAHFANLPSVVYFPKTFP
jgi:predicted nucleic acid-binding protein